MAVQKKHTDRRCDICYRMRPEEAIDERMSDLSESLGIDPIYLGVVVSYCTDTESCRRRSLEVMGELADWLRARHSEIPFRRKGQRIQAKPATPEVVPVE